MLIGAPMRAKSAGRALFVLATLGVRYIEEVESMLRPARPMQPLVGDSGIRSPLPRFGSRQIGTPLVERMRPVPHVVDPDVREKMLLCHLQDWTAQLPIEAIGGV